MSDPPHKLLDHLEVRALTDSDGNASASELRSELEITGSQDAFFVEEDAVLETPAERIEGVLEAVFTEAEYRISACGEQYPFQLNGNVLLRRDEDAATVYTFLLLLSEFGEGRTRGPNGAKLFEDVCAHAASGYFGCQETETYVFGFPRRIGPKNFIDAVTTLCNKLREGQPDKNSPRASVKKDGGLDIVAWRNFPDLRSSKLIAFGQCATGQNWHGKTHELLPETWCRKWLLKHPLAKPLKMFFLPHAVSESEWSELGYDAGVIFDRFRIAYHSELAIPETLRKSLQDWNSRAKSRI